MTYHVFFWALCVLLAVQLVVAVISIVKAYRNEGRLHIGTDGVTGIF